MSQDDHDTTVQRKTPIRIPKLGKLGVQIGQGVEVRPEFGDESSRPLEPER
jgi:hypothetical protein